MMPEQSLSVDDRAFLLNLARQTIDNFLHNKPLPNLDLHTLNESLREVGASFVTLTIRGYLRGCVGTLEAYQSLAEDVREHAIAAAFQDYRFPPLQLNEFNDIAIEISCLSKPKMLDYKDSEDLIRKVRPKVDGVVLRDGIRRATFLPQVWEKIQDPIEFLEQLCMKMGSPPDTWRRKKLDVLTYQVEEFHE